MSKFTAVQNPFSSKNYSRRPLVRNIFVRIEAHVLAKNKKFGVRNKARSWILHYNLYKARRSTLAKE